METKKTINLDMIWKYIWSFGKSYSHNDDMLMWKSLELCVFQVYSLSILTNDNDGVHLNWS